MQSYLINSLRAVSQSTQSALQTVQAKISDSTTALKDFSLKAPKDECITEEAVTPKPREEVIIQNPSSDYKPKLVESSKAPNSTLRVLVQSARQQGKDDDCHTVNLLNCLAESDIIDVDRLRQLAFLGVPDDVMGLRPVIWRVLLGHWASDTQEWDS